MSNSIPETMKVEIHFHVDKYTPGKIQVFTTDMSDIGYPHLGKDIVIVTVPDCDPVKAEIDMLETKADQVRREMGDQLHNIEQRIKELAAIEYKPEGRDSE